ncbi:hypothetical protein [Tolypothrix sp. VBCCA 56010]|uniref:hypothetical protein n=1 Tax=Tolypothrix sp. VBCCA 56010 TaxID=3137731 RepID=UPI003D7EBF95
MAMNVLAIADRNFRPTFGDLAKIGIGGYLGQLLPEAKRSGDSPYWMDIFSPDGLAYTSGNWEKGVGCVITKFNAPLIVLDAVMNGGIPPAGGFIFNSTHLLIGKMILQTMSINLTYCKDVPLASSLRFIPRLCNAIFYIPALKSAWECYRVSTPSAF